jgi:ATP-dependent Clp protease ATP-binding subunit ClpC
MGRSLDLTVPLFTKKETSDREYVARPLLTGEPSCESPRYKQALKRCARTIRDRIPKRVDRSDLDTLLWYGFNPELTVRTIELTFESGQRVVSGPYTVAWFEVNGTRYACLPGFDHHIFVPRREESGGYNMEEEVTRTIQALLRKKRPEGETLDHEVYQASERDDVTRVRLSKYVRFGEFPFSSSGSSFEGLLGGAIETFEGGLEISKVAEDLSQRYPADLDRAYHREEVVQRLRDRLYRGDPAATVIVGPSGAGKTAVLHEAIYRHLDDAQDGSSNDFRALSKQPKVWHLSPSRVIAGMSRIGMWQRRFESILSFAQDRLSIRHNIDRSDILYVDELVALLRLGKSAQSDLTLAGVLKPHLENRALPFLGEATPDVWTRVQEIDQRFADLFNVVRLPEPSPAEAWQIVTHHRAQLEKNREAHITAGALARLKDVQQSFPARRAMPGRAADALDRLVSRHGTERIGAEAVDEMFLERSKMRPEVADTTTTVSPSSVRDFIEERLIGQPEATDCLLDTISVAKARLGSPTSPIASLLFIGPTGVGKTEAAKVLRESLFEDAECLLRFNMNEYVDDEAVSRLVGDLQNPGGHLTNKVRFQDSAVILLDEIEKAHPSVHNLLLQVLDEGHLTDALGRTVDFTQTVIVMTSNLGAEEAASAIGFETEAATSKSQIYRGAVEDYFRPEFVNRIDRIVSFQPLDLEAIKQITRLQIQQFLRRVGFTRRTTVLNLSGRALDQIAEDGFDPELGGRALKRSIEQNVAPLIADHLVQIGPDDPVILDLFLREGALHPRVTPLSVTEEKAAGGKLLDAHLSDEPEVEAFYDELSDRTADLQVSLEDEDTPELVYAGGGGDDDHAVDPELLLYKDRLRHLHEDLKQLVEDVGSRPPSDRLLSLTLRGPLRKEAWPPGWDDWRKGRPDPSDIYEAYFQKLEIREYLEQAYAAAERVLRNAPEETIRRYAEVASLDFLHPVFASQISRDGSAGGDVAEPTEACIHIRSLVEGQGRSRMRYLRERFEQVAQIFYPETESFDALLKDETELYLHVPFSRMDRFYEPEDGVHLFFEAYGGALPLQVRVLEIPDTASPTDFAQADRAARTEWVRRFEQGDAAESDDPHQPETVVRIYTPPDAGQDGTITDLRTGLMDRYDTGRYAWFLWIYNALPEQMRMPVPVVK